MLRLAEKFGAEAECAVFKNVDVSNLILLKFRSGYFNPWGHLFDNTLFLTEVQACILP